MMLPRGWADAEVLSETYEMMDSHDFIADPIEAMVTDIEIDKRHAFTVGILYGMALEAGKDEPLPERLYHRGEQ